MQIEICPGTSKDLPDIHNLVLELAEYEKSAHEFTATLEDYQRDFAEGTFEVLVAKQEQTIVGMALYYMTYSTWKGKMLYLEDFVVQKAHRRKGIGDALFEAFLSVAKNKGCRLVKWQVLDWNEPAIHFYKKKSATIEQEWWNGKIFL